MSVSPDDITGGLVSQVQDVGIIRYGFSFVIGRIPVQMPIYHRIHTHVDDTNVVGNASDFELGLLML